jgi:hypothetical protein
MGILIEQDSKMNRQSESQKMNQGGPNDVMLQICEAFIQPL